MIHKFSNSICSKSNKVLSYQLFFKWNYFSVDFTNLLYIQIFSIFHNKDLHKFGCLVFASRYSSIYSSISSSNPTKLLIYHTRSLKIRFVRCYGQSGYTFLSSFLRLPSIDSRIVTLKFFRQKACSWL